MMFVSSFYIFLVLIVKDGNDGLVRGEEWRMGRMSKLNFNKKKIEGGRERERERGNDQGDREEEGKMPRPPIFTGETGGRVINDIMGSNGNIGNGSSGIGGNIGGSGSGSSGEIQIIITDEGGNEIRRIVGIVTEEEKNGIIDSLSIIADRQGGLETQPLGIETKTQLKSQSRMGLDGELLPLMSQTKKNERKMVMPSYKSGKGRKEGIGKRGEKIIEIIIERGGERGMEKKIKNNNDIRIIIERRGNKEATATRDKKCKGVTLKKKKGKGIKIIK